MKTRAKRAAPDKSVIITAIEVGRMMRCHHTLAERWLDEQGIRPVFRTPVGWPRYSRALVVERIHLAGAPQ